jgi:hypothetical protein
MGDFFSNIQNSWKVSEKSKTEVSGGFSSQFWTLGYFPIIFPPHGLGEPEINVCKFRKSKGKLNKKNRKLHFHSFFGLFKVRQKCK